jgi:hypothetical protein
MEAIRLLGLTYKNADGSIGAISDATESDPNMLFYPKTEADERIRMLEDALRELVDALDMVHNDPEYMAVWKLYQQYVPAGYRGRKYTAQLDKAREALDVK